MIFHGDQPILVKKICAEGQIVHGDYTGNGDRLGGKGGAHGHGLAGHGKGIFAVRHLVCHVNAAHGQRLQRIVLVRGHGDGDLNPLGGLLVIGGDGAVLGLLYGDGVGLRRLGFFGPAAGTVGLDLGGIAASLFAYFHRQVIVAVGRNHNSGRKRTIISYFQGLIAAKSPCCIADTPLCSAFKIAKRINTGIHHIVDSDLIDFSHPIAGVATKAQV